MALQDHPDRAELVTKNPNMTRREAREHVLAYKGRCKQKSIDAAAKAIEQTRAFDDDAERKIEKAAVQKWHGQLLMEARRAAGAARSYVDWAGDVDPGFCKKLEPRPKSGPSSPSGWKVSNASSATSRATSMPR